MIKISVIKEKISQMVVSPYFPFVFYGLLIFLIHCDIDLQWGDDVFFANVLGDEGSFQVWIQYLRERYQNWTSRLIIEGLLVILVHFPLIWRIIDTVLVIWIAIALSLIFNNKNSVKLNWWIILLLLAFPFETMNSAGWMATTLNYLWPLAFGFIGMIPVNNLLKQKKNSVQNVFFSSIALCYAINQEQMCAIVLAISLFGSIYFYIERKKVYKIIIFDLLLSTISLVFIISCPGNTLRKEQEIVTWFPSFNELTIFDKLEIGYSSSLFEFFMKPNLIFFLFSIMLFTFMCIQKRKITNYIIASLPLMTSIIMGMFVNIFSLIFPNITALTTSLTDTGTNIKITEINTWFPDLFITVILICILASIWSAFLDKKIATVLIYTALVGLASRGIMGFSPTIWGSGSRTFIFMYFSFIIISVMLFKEILRLKILEKGLYKLMVISIAVACIFIFENILYYIKIF